MKISMIIPCYNSERTINSVCKKNQKIFEENGYDYELILVNDCSKDSTWEEINRISKDNNKVFGINLSKNSGQHAAIIAGLKLSKGDIIMCSDDDGQTPVENIPQLINLLLEKNYDVTSAKYVDFENKSLGRRLGTVLFKKIVDLTMDHPENIELRVFFAARRFVIDEVIKYTQPYPSINGLILRVTHNIGNVEMIQHSRKEGKSGYSFRKLVKGWLNGFTAFSIVPLHLASLLGFVSAFIGVVGAIVVIVKKIINPSVQIGWTSIASLLLISLGTILFVLGIIGDYIGRIYMSINGTPPYVIKDVTDNYLYKEHEKE